MNNLIVISFVSLLLFTRCSDSPDKIIKTSSIPFVEMNESRAGHTSTLLDNGKVLIAGGFNENPSMVVFNTAELYDPVSKSFTYTGTMNERRNTHTATLLNNGKVLIAGGWGRNEKHSSAELYDPETGKFTPVGNLSIPRAAFTATLLSNGMVLIAGGTTAELFNPATNMFTETGGLIQGRFGHTATLLNNGNVLLIGGSYDNNVIASAEMYNTETGKFTILQSSLNNARYKHASVLLNDGNVLIVGGANNLDWQGQLNSAELYEAATGIFVDIPALNNRRFKISNACAKFGDGSILVAGGNKIIELFNPLAGAFINEDNLDDSYFTSTATQLKGNRVLIAGGYNANIHSTNKAWIYGE
jgi:hypothetical protein